MADDTQIEGLPEGATVKPLQTEEETAPPQPTGDKSSIEGLPAGATVRALPPAPPEKSMAGAGGSFDAPSSTASKVWEAANKPLVPEGRAEKEGKEYAKSAPTLKESEHPYLTGAAKGLAGGYADTLGFVRGLTSPISVAAMGLGALGEVPGAMGKIAKPASRIAAGGFGAQGAQQAVEGGMNIAKEGITPENIKQTLGGAGMAALGTAGTIHGTEMGEAPAQKTLAAPIRAASKLGKPLSHVIPSVGGIIAASEMGIPHPFIVGGTLGRFALPPAYLESIFEKGRTLGLNPEEAQITRLQERYDDAVKAAKQPEKDYKAHQAGREQGIPAPDDVLKAHEKAQTALQSAREHLAAAQDDYSAKLAGKAAPPDQDITPDAVAAARPEAPTPTNEELNTRQNALMGKIEKQVGIGVPPAENVKVPGQVQPEVFPMTPTEAPRVTMGRTELAGGKGTMGNPRLLTEGVPDRPEPMAEGTPNRPEPIGEVLPPEKPAKPAKPGRMGKLKVNDKGIVVDTEDPLQQKIEEGLQGVPKAVATPAPKAEVTVPKSEKTLGEREAALLEKMRAVSKSEIPEKTTVTGHELGVAPIETKAEDVGAKVRAEAPPMPRGERRASVRTPEENEATEMFRQARKDLGDDATNEQIDARIAEIKAGKATGKIGEAPSEEPKGSPEDRTMVEHTINELPNQELQNLGAKYGLSTSTKDYDFSKREPLREGGSKHPVDRNRFHKDLMSKLPQGLADAIARESKAWDEKNPHTFDPASRSSKWRADRAKEILGKAQEDWSAGKPKPSMKTARMSNEELLNNGYTQDQIDKGDHLPTAGGGTPDTVGTKEGAEKDTDHFAQAKKELPNGTLSEQLGRAQELKSQGKPKAADKGTPDEEPGTKEAWERLRRTGKNTADSAPAKQDGYSAKYSDERLAKANARQAAEDLREQIGAHNADGGSTFHPTKGNLKGQPYFSVGGEPEFRNPKLSMVTEGGEMSADQLKEFSERPEVKAALAKHPDASIGTWHDTEADQTITELVKTPTDRDEAIEMGKKNNQKAIFDLKEGKEIPTGGTGEVKSAGVAGALQEIKDKFQINPNKPGADTIPEERVSIGEEGKPEAAFTVSERDGKLRLKGIQSLDPRTGAGSRALKALTDIADKHNVTMELTASPYGEEAGRLNSEQLKDWYSRHGFVPEEGHDPALSYMIREPKTAEPAKPYRDMTKEEQEALAAKGQSGASGKALTGDQLIKKYGESEGDPAHTAFILKDGRGVNLPDGVVHDEMLGGHMYDKIPPREAFIADGNIRIRPRTGKGGREFSISVPESGITESQLAHLNRMAPQMGSGTVNVEIGKPGGDYRQIEYGKASSQLEQTLRDLVPIKNAKGSPVDEFGNPTVSGGSGAAAPKPAKEANVPLGELAEKHGTAEEKAGVNKSVASTKRFVDNMSKIPEVHEYTDIANAGSGARKWYQRSTKAFDAMAEEAPTYFDKEGDRDKFINLLAASSPRQSVAMNLRETLRTWKEYVDQDRPTGGALKKLLDENLTPAASKTPNALKALNGEEMWPDITKNKNFKVPSFARNLRGYLDSVTNDGWMSLFAGLGPKEISSAHSYHPLSIATRAAAEELGWEPAEAQAAIWSFTQALTERGETLPEEVRKHSEDFVDLMQNDPQVRQLLSDLGVSHGNLDAKLAAIGAKPEVSSRTSPTTSRSIERVKQRIETARGKGAIPPSKSAQGELGFREAPAGESRNRVDDEGDTSFNPDEIMGKKKKVGMGK